MNKSIGYEKAFKFSVRVVNLYKYLCSGKKEYILSKQILRSGTSIAANMKEASQAQSRKDFLSKMNIALKEASETEYWLDLLVETDYIDRNMHRSMNEDCAEILKILVSTVKTVRQSIDDS